ncbi:MAG: transposase family protein [Gammaproteobacteria bacterium]|nr:transposase family protein [Gammaproteobacteria bacterium]
MSQIDWPTLIHDLGLGHPLKFLWEERARQLTTYPNFWKQFYRKFRSTGKPRSRRASSSPASVSRSTTPAIRSRGSNVPTGEIRKAWVFVAGLGFSQLLFAWAAEDMKSRNWLASHRRMYAYYGGVPHVTVPDCLKQGVLKCHLYDPDLNPAYAQLAADYATAVVPARPDHPRDKAIAEGLVKILMRYVRFRYGAGASPRSARSTRRWPSASTHQRATSLALRRLAPRAL